MGGPAILSLVAALSAGASTSYAGWFGPRNYDECVLDKMKDANNPAAVHAVIRACERLFPPKVLPLPDLAQHKLVITTIDEKANGNVAVVVDNRNSDWTIDSFKMVFIESPGRPGSVSVDPRRTAVDGDRAVIYDVDDAIPASSSLRVEFQFDRAKSYYLRIHAPKGHR